MEMLGHDMGNPWVTRPLPAPTPVWTRTREHRYGFRWVWVWVPMGRESWHHIITIFTSPLRHTVSPSDNLHHCQWHLKTWPNTPMQLARTWRDTQDGQVYKYARLLFFFFNLFYLYCLGYSRSPAQQYDDDDGHGTRTTRKPGLHH